MHALPPAVDIDALSRSFRRGRVALDIPKLAIMDGQMVALIGASGSGKSTLLRHIAALTLADRGSGRVSVHGHCVQQGGRAMPDVRRTRAQVGFVFQQFNLVERLPVITNVLAGALARVPLWRSQLGWFTAAETRRAMEALDRVGIADLAQQRASTLSGGQQQRAAIARALVQGARIILADEPIASLDPESSRRVMEILRDLNQQDGITVIVSLHQVEIALQYCRRIIALRDGRIVQDADTAHVSAADLARIYQSMPPPAPAQPPAAMAGLAAAAV